MRSLSTVGLGGILHLAYSWVVRPWHLEWGATQQEVATPMPGDDLVPHPTVCSTRAVTIEATPAAVWPWLVQMGGYERAGWYSYDFFDNAGQQSANRIVPELQALQVGDVMLTSPDGGFTVRRIEPERAIVLFLERDGSRVSSVPMLSPVVGNRCRLVFRVRAYFRPRHRLFAAAFDVGDFVFLRKLMLGVKQRAEVAPGD